jgi:lipopolysaccharide transport system permease protein
MTAEARIQKRELIIRPESRFSLRGLGDVWEHRELLFILAARDVKVRYKQAALGAAWAVLQPVTQMLVFTVLLNRFAGIGSGSALPYPVFCFSGLVVWTVFSSGLSQASESLISNSQLVTKVYFPRVLLPLAAVGSALVDFAIAFALLIVLALWLRVPLAATAPLALFMAIPSACCAVALGLWTSAINLQFRDARHALPFFMQLLVFGTPVLYPAAQVPERWRPLLLLNPMAPVVDGFRALLFGQRFPVEALALGLLLMALVGAMGFIRFRALETTFADRV